MVVFFCFSLFSFWKVATSVERLDKSYGSRPRCCRGNTVEPKTRDSENGHNGTMENNGVKSHLGLFESERFWEGAWTAWILK